MKMKRIDSINVIPFIDIMLVLLVMVLTTATFIKTGLIPVDLPKSSATASEHKPQEMKITIKKDGTLWVDEKTQVSLDLKTLLVLWMYSNVLDMNSFIL